MIYKEANVDIDDVDEMEEYFLRTQSYYYPGADPDYDAIKAEFKYHKENRND